MKENDDLPNEFYEISDFANKNIPERSDFEMKDYVDITMEETDKLIDNDELDEEIDKNSAQEAADYAQFFGFEKAAEYIQNHYYGDDFIPGEPIRIATRNMALDGKLSDNGVLFELQTVELTHGLVIEGVFPKFESKHHVDIGIEANDMTIHQQFNACKEDFQIHMYDCPEKLQDITFGDMERMDMYQGYTPEGYTWDHNPKTGCFDLVSKDDHKVGHTGGNALWGD